MDKVKREEGKSGAMEGAPQTSCCWEMSIIMNETDRRRRLAFLCMSRSTETAAGEESGGLMQHNVHH